MLMDMMQPPAPSVLPGKVLVFSKEGISFQESFSSQQSLRAVFDDPLQRASLSLQKLCLLLARVSQLLFYAHQQGVVHRDLKPESILLSGEELALIGWEQARFLGEVESASDSQDSSPIGTAGYMPPEQARGERKLFEPASDLYSLGAILYEALSGKAPFAGRPRLAVILATMEQEIPPLRSVAPHCPEEIARFCAKLLAKLPAARPKDASLAAQELSQLAVLFEEKAQDSTPPAPSQESQPPEKNSSEASLLRGEALTETRLSPDAPADTGPTVEASGAASSNANSLPGDRRLPTVPNSVYTSIGELGRGGLGRVTKAHDTRLQRTVAIKELLRQNYQAKERFLREALLTAKLQHPGIIPIYEAGVWPTGEPFYSMKMVSGKPLSELIESRQTLEERLALIPQIIAACDAVAFAHSQKIIHRDLKPANILLGEFGETVVIDWGLAKDLSQTATEPEELDLTYRAPASGSLTVTGAIMGTPAYMPPEQAQGKQVDEKADVYSLGAILYHLLDGRSPFQGRNPRSVLLEVAEGKLTPLVEKQPRAPKDLLAIVQKAMAFQPNERYPSAKELADDLRQFQTGQLVGAYQYTTKEKFWRWVSRYRFPIGVLGAALLTVSTVSAVSLQRIFAAERGKVKAEQAKLEIEQEKRMLAEAQAAKEKKANEEATLKNIRNLLSQDPAKALTALQSFYEENEGYSTGLIRTLAQDAILRGLPKDLDKHEAPVRWLALSPDGGALVTGDANGQIHLQNTKTKELKTINAHTGGVERLYFTKAGESFFSCGTDGAVYQWDARSGERIASFLGHKAPVTRLALSSDEKALVSADEAGEVLLWGVQSQGSFRLEGHTGPILGLLFSSGGARVISSSTDGTTRIWDASSCGSESGPCTATVLPSHPSFLRGLRITPQDQLLLMSPEGILQSYQLSTKETVNLTDRVLQISFFELSPDGKYLAVGTEEGIYLWDLTTKIYRLLVGMQEKSTFFGFSRDSERLAASTESGAIWLWELSDLQGRAHPLLGHSSYSRALAFTPDGEGLFSSGADGRVLFWSLDEILGRALAKNPAPPLVMRFSSDQKRLAVSSALDNQIYLWESACLAHETAICAPAQTLSAGDQPFNELHFSSSGSRLIALNNLGVVYTWELTSGSSKQLTTQVTTLSASPTEEKLAVACNDQIEVWDLSLETKQTLTGHKGMVYTVAFSPDGRYLASSDEKELRLWEVERLHSYAQHPLDVSFWSLVWSPDGRSLAAADGLFRVHYLLLSGERPTWKEDKLLLVESAQSHKSVVGKLAFSPDGKRLLSASGEQARLWDLTTKESLRLPTHSFAVDFWNSKKSIFFVHPSGALKSIDDDLPDAAAGLKASLLALTRSSN